MAGKYAKTSCRPAWPIRWWRSVFGVGSKTRNPPVRCLGKTRDATGVHPCPAGAKHLASCRGRHHPTVRGGAHEQLYAGPPNVAFDAFMLAVERRIAAGMNLPV